MIEPLTTLPSKRFSLSDLSRDGEDSLLDLYRVMRTARTIDEVERDFVSRGKIYFHISGAGHEASAVLNLYLRPDDWLFPHYRDKALLLGRGMPAEHFLHNDLCTAHSDSHGRQLGVHFSDPKLNVMSMAGPVGGHALHAVGAATTMADRSDRRLVVCSIGDGTTQEGEVLEAVAEAVRTRLPVLFWIEDNGFSISTTTHGNTFYSLPSGEATHYLGLPIHRLDGRDAVSCIAPLRAIIGEIRATRGPAIVVFRVARLADHSNADDERIYKTTADIAQAKALHDPVRLLADRLAGLGVPQTVLDEIDESASAFVHAAVERVLHSPSPVELPSTHAVNEAKRPLPAHAFGADREYRGQGGERQCTMLEAMRDVLRHRLATDNRVTLFGEDIEDPKGDIFGVTKGLSTSFPGRVRNSALAEATIVGTSIGKAMAGGRPVAMIQFADFIPSAFNQIASELGSMFWRTNGGWECPVIIMAACGAYRPGLGPFHAQTYESVAAHLTGIDVLMPSTAGDAAGLLNAAFASSRPTLFLYPKICLNAREPHRTTSPDVKDHWVPIGAARFVARGGDLTIVTWGSTVVLCEEAVTHLTRAGIGVDLIDLRSIAPWDQESVSRSVKATGRLLVVHEDNLTCGFGAEVIAAVSETMSGCKLPISVKRVARPDTHVPCHFVSQQQALPSLQRVLSAAAEMLELELDWESKFTDISDGRFFEIKAIGASPSDHAVKLLRWRVKPGDKVAEGATLAEVEADKASFEMSSPVAGTVQSLLIEEDVSVKIGAPIARLEVELGKGNSPTANSNGSQIHSSKVPLLRQKPGPRETEKPKPDSNASAKQAFILNVESSLGSLTVSNEDLLGPFTAWTSADVVEKVGIVTRPRVGPGENVITLAVDAVRKLMSSSGLDSSQIAAVICSTGNGVQLSPSIACEIVTQVLPDARGIQAIDINAACAGYVYALQQAHDLIKCSAAKYLIVVTSEVMSPLLNRADQDTVFLFGDAATATLVGSAPNGSGISLALNRPVLLASPDKKRAIEIPGKPHDPLRMNGIVVAREASKTMASLLEQACRDVGIAVGDLDVIVPHQASKRIIESVAWHANIPAERVLVTLPTTGNTSSSSIPIGLQRTWNKLSMARRIGLVAFGAGFAAGAVVLDSQTTGGYHVDYPKT